MPSRAASSGVFPVRVAWTDAISVHCITNHLLVSRCQGDCAVAIDTPGGKEAERAPAINGSSTASSLRMRLAETCRRRAVSHPLDNNPLPRTESFYICAPYSTKLLVTSGWQWGFYPGSYCPRGFVFGRVNVRWFLAGGDCHGVNVRTPWAVARRIFVASGT